MTIHHWSDLNDGFEAKMMDKLIAYPMQKGSSMLTDRLNGNQVELDAKNKIISELGNYYGINTS